MIPQINNILYASDLGESARPAFTLAAKEAFKHEAQLTFLNVVEPASGATEALLDGYLGDVDLQSMRADGIAKIRELMEQRIGQFYDEELQNRLPLKFYPQARVEEGPAAETIIQVAEEMNADLIVMGTRTRTHSALGRFFVGSTAQSVLQLCDRPMMIVPLK